jgi:transcriptional regulator with XRE-family HTH domain
MTEPETLGQSLRRLRRGAGLSEEQLAAQAGVPEFELRQLEGDSCKPHLPTLERLVRALGASFGDLSIVVPGWPEEGGQGGARRVPQRPGRRGGAGGRGRPGRPALLAPAAPELKGAAPVARGNRAGEGHSASQSDMGLVAGTDVMPLLPHPGRGSAPCRRRPGW